MPSRVPGSFHRWRFCSPSVPRTAGNSPRDGPRSATRERNHIAPSAARADDERRLGRVDGDRSGCLESLSAPWQLAFEAAAREETLRLQDAALGVNAHVNYDLAHALDAVEVESDRDAKYDGQSAMTDHIRRLVDEAQDSLVERDAVAVETLTETFGRFDECGVTSAERRGLEKRQTAPRR